MTDTPRFAWEDEFAERVAKRVAEGLRAELQELVADPADYKHIEKLKTQVQLQARTIASLQAQLRDSNESHAHALEST